MIIIGICFTFISALCIGLYIKLSQSRIQLATLLQTSNNFELTRHDLTRQINDLFQEKSRLQLKLEEYIERASKAQTNAENLSQNNSKLEEDYTNLQKLYNDSQEALFELKKNIELKIQEMTALEKRMTDWEGSRAEAIGHAKAAIFEAGSKLSEQLLEQHKTETKESREKIAKTTSELQNQFEKILNTVAIMDSEIKSSKQTVELVKNSLLTPTGAGNLSEITLENILKASGLSRDRDYIMQYSLTPHDQGKLRPDAVVFLPSNNILIIDSKASKFFVELAEATEENKVNVQTQLKQTMRNHTKQLASKDYQEALRQHLHNHEINHIISVMFLPSESAIEKLGQIDKEFIEKSWQQDIFPVGPTGLVNILSNAKFQISRMKQEQNQQLIIEEVRKLLNAFTVFAEYARKIGNSLQSASSNYDKLASSFNGNLLPKARNLEKLGVHVQKSKTLPQALDRLTIISSEKMPLIETHDYHEESEEKELKND